MATIPSFSDGGILHASDLQFLENPPQGGFSRAASQSIPNSVTTVITGDTLSFDTDPTMWASTPAPTRLIINTPGKWLITAGVTWSVNSTGVRELDLRKNAVGSPTGGVDIVIDTRAAIPSLALGMTLAIEVPNLIAGDYFELFVNQNSGGALGVTAHIEAKWQGT